MRCSACGSENDNAFRYCGQCGKPLERPPQTQPGTVKCPQCGYDNEGNSKFCQECGTPLIPPSSKEKPSGTDNEGPASGPAVIPGMGITIEFSYSTSQSFEFALRAAQQFPTFRQSGEAKKAIYQVTIVPSEMEAAAELVEQLKGWRRRAVYVNGEKTTWDSVFAFHWCFQRKKASFKPQFYCFGYEHEYEINPWGCIHSGLPFSEHQPWFCWGKWLNRDGEWQFDKDRIRHELQKNLFPFRFCPGIDLARCEGVLNVLPDRVNPKRDKNWKFVESYGDDTVNGLKMIRESYGFKEEVIMKGVSPNGPGTLKEIGKRLKMQLPDNL